MTELNRHHRHIEFVGVYSSQEPDHPTQVEVIKRMVNYAPQRTDSRPSESYFVRVPTSPIVNGVTLDFHEGCNPAEGTNGFLTEDLVAILHHRFSRYQDSPFKHPSNAAIILKLEEVMDLMLDRRRERQARNVSGTQKV